MEDLFLQFVTSHTSGSTGPVHLLVDRPTRRAGHQEGKKAEKKVLQEHRTRRRHCSWAGPVQVPCS
jgi:hypothetical protein